MDISFMPDEILIHIFEYLRVEDINSCRLVCRRWYSCADVWSIRKSEKYVFQGGVLTTTEINDLLVNHTGRQISVEFSEVVLDELRFKEFGAKIRALEINECFYDSLTNIFLSTPNMKCLTYRYGEDECGERQLRDLTIGLHKNNAVMRNLEKLQCFCPDYDEDNIFNFFSKPFASVFPRLTSITLPEIGFDLNESLKCLLIQNNVTELRNVWFPPVGYFNDEIKNMDLCLQYDTIKLLPRFTKLAIRITLTLDLCFEFFSRQSCLETLEIYFSVQEGSYVTKSGKQLLLHVLDNCKRLKILHFYLEHSKYNYEYLHLNHTDMQLFKEVIARSNSIIDLVMPPITIDGSTQASFFALFNGLKYLDMGRSIKYDFENQTKNFLPLICQELMEIINLQQCLKKLKMRAFWTSWPVAERVPNVDYNLNVRHLRSDRLEHLELNFDKYTSIIVETIILWEFPNLSTLVLDNYRKLYADPVELDLECNKRILNWILAMPSLKKIRLHWFDLKDDQYLNICRNLPSLETIFCKALEAPSKNEIKMIFVNRRALKKVAVHVKKHRCKYVIKRSKNSLYCQKCVVEHGELRYLPWES